MKKRINWFVTMFAAFAALIAGIHGAWELVIALVAVVALVWIQNFNR